jgi:hypothetical protein
MRKKIALGSALGLAPAGIVVASPSVGVASTTSVDLAMSGSVVGGVTSGVDLGHELAFSFSLKNRSTATATQVDFAFTFSGGTADNSDYICPSISTHGAINPDTPSCEPGMLGYGKTAQAALLVTQTARPLTVTACAFNMDGYTDPTPSNNCKTLTVK